ncbi:MAG: hypothetical protein OXB92_03475 [Acidimicrobiaceae bacterium]|nr:hypothetical protein [Acidimicrobiia bacterium]MCY4492903.1 hypothetical protein [Acidimicrobiaceae bacterium]
MDRPQNRAPTEIVCVDCGGVCHRLSYAPDEGDEPGDIVAYRCSDCNDRWDVELAPDDLEPPGGF